MIHLSSNWISRAQGHDRPRKIDKSLSLSLSVVIRSPEYHVSKRWHGCRKGLKAFRVWKRGYFEVIRRLTRIINQPGTRALDPDRSRFSSWPTLTIGLTGKTAYTIGRFCSSSNQRYGISKFLIKIRENEYSFDIFLFFFFLLEN